MSPEGGVGAEGSAGSAAVPDPGQLIRSAGYRRLLVVSAVLGVVVSVACWAFLEVTHALQQGLYVHLPDTLGLDPAPWWWPLPVLAVAGLLVGLAVSRLPGHGGHEPSEGLHTGAPTRAVDLPGVLLAATATVGLGLVLGPEAPLIALGSGLAMLAMDRSRRPVPDQVRTVVAAAAGFAALATIFGSPVIGAVIIIEAAGIGGPMLPLILLPGLMAGGIGSLVFLGIGSVTGLSSKAYALPPLSLPTYSTPTVPDFLWVFVLAVLVALLVSGVMRLAGVVRDVVARSPVVLTTVASLLVGIVAVTFERVTGESAHAVLFSGQEAMASVVAQAGSVSLGALVLLVVCKSLAWSVSLGAARGGPTFPGIFVGLVAGLLCAHLPGLAQTPAVGALVAAAVVSVLRLPLSAIILALLITQAGAGVAPLVIVAVVVAYVTTLALDAGRTRSDLVT